MPFCRIFDQNKQTVHKMENGRDIAQNLPIDNISIKEKAKRYKALNLQHQDELYAYVPIPVRVIFNFKVSFERNRSVGK